MTVERIEGADGPLALVIRSHVAPEATEFVTPDELPFQAGFIVYGAGAEIPRHVHRPLERSLVGTSEVLLVRSGSCEIDLYDEGRSLVRTVELREHDVIVMFGGGHGLRMLEDTVLLEIKQGPYTGLDEKERF